MVDDIRRVPLPLKSLILEHMGELVAAQHWNGGVYIAIIEGDTGYDLEVEVSSGDITFVCPTGTRTLKRARAEADRLESLLDSEGIHVYPTRDSWERSLNSGFL